MYIQSRQSVTSNGKLVTESGLDQFLFVVKDHICTVFAKIVSLVGFFDIDASFSIGQICICAVCVTPNGDKTFGIAPVYEEIASLIGIAAQHSDRMSYSGLGIACSDTVLNGHDGILLAASYYSAGI